VGVDFGVKADLTVWVGTGWDVVGWDGTGSVGTGRDRLGRDGIGWEGMGWDGMGWDWFGSDLSSPEARGEMRGQTRRENQADIGRKRDTESAEEKGERDGESHRCRD
jgi:hypothetical protein